MTVATWVCWSMNSETRIAYGSRVRRHGRSRPCNLNQPCRLRRNCRPSGTDSVDLALRGMRLAMMPRVEDSPNRERENRGDKKPGEEGLWDKKLGEEKDERAEKH